MFAEPHHRTSIFDTLMEKSFLLFLTKVLAPSINVMKQWRNTAIRYFLVREDLKTPENLYFSIDWYHISPLCTYKVKRRGCESVGRFAWNPALPLATCTHFLFYSFIPWLIYSKFITKYQTLETFAVKHTAAENFSFFP